MESMIHTKLHQSDKAKNVNVKNKKSKRSADSHSKSFLHFVANLENRTRTKTRTCKV